MLRFLTAGESHGESLSVIIDGLPAGLKINIDKINKALEVRQYGLGRGQRMNIEKDQAHIISGVRLGETLGSPVCVLIKNKDNINWKEKMSLNFIKDRERLEKIQTEKLVSPRPGHADLSGILKYNRDDCRDILERASARETAARVVMGNISNQLLEELEMKTFSCVLNIGGIKISEEKILNDLSFSQLTNLKNKSKLGDLNKKVEKTIVKKFFNVKQKGNTLGGIVAVAVFNCIIGLGSFVQYDKKLDALLAREIVSVPAIKGVEFGLGFHYAHTLGSAAHDVINYSQEEKKYYRKTNNAGGIEGGMSNGERIIIKAVMKPIPTLMHPLETVNIETKEQVKASTERSDAYAVSSCAYVVESMVSFVLAKEILRKFSKDCMIDLKQSISAYKSRIEQM